MARELGPKCKKCRREGEKLFLKGDRCLTQKCAMVKRKYPPGVHGQRRSRRPSSYGIQLRQKQKAKRIYGVLEKQFRGYYEKAIRKAGDTGTNMLTILESRLDNAVYRAGLAGSRTTARQYVNHGHFTVNGRKVDVPSYLLKSGDVVKVKKNSAHLKQIAERAAVKAKSDDIPTWLAVEPRDAQFKVLSLPSAGELPQNINVKLIIEYYSK